ncbi:hypothetical protein OCB15_28545 [Bacillus cereus]|nr:hypothetical protein [Bacillus cereus]
MEKILKLILMYYFQRKKFDKQMSSGLNFLFFIFTIGVPLLLIVLFSIEAYKQISFANSYFKGEQNRGMVVLDTEENKDTVKVLLRNCNGLLVDPDEEPNTFSNLSTPYEYDSNVYKLEYVWTKSDGTSEKFGRTNINPKGVNYDYIYQHELFGEYAESAYITIPKDMKLELSCKNRDYQTLQTVTMDYLGSSLKIDSEYLIDISLSEKIKKFWRAIDFFVFLVIVIFIIFYIRKRRRN